MSDRVAWEDMLATWVDAARAAASFPDHGPWARLKAAMPDVIALQALTLASEDALSRGWPTDRLRAAADLADVLLRTHEARVLAAWNQADGSAPRSPASDAPPAGLIALIEDARDAARRLREAGVTP